MMMTALASLAMVLATQQKTDTTFNVKADGRIEVNNFGGEIVVHAWDKPQVRIKAEHSRRDSIQIRGSESAVQVSLRSRFGPGGAVDYDITVPTTMAVSIKGTYTDITVEGTRAKIVASTMQGDVMIRGGAELVTAKSVEGRVEVSGTRGRVEARGTNRGIRVSDVVGDITAETINGGVTITGADATNVDAASVNGQIFYDGSLKGGGLYTFTSHDGGVTVAMPDKPNATVSVATMEGRFSSSFPSEQPDSLSSSSRRRRRFNVTLGDGSAKVEAESFSGSIRLVKKGEVSPPVRKDD